MTTSRERVLTVLSGGLPDRIPWMESYVSNEVLAALQGRRAGPATPHASKVLLPPEARRWLPIDNVTYDFSPPRFARTVRSGGQDIITDGHIHGREDLHWLDKLPDPDDEALYRPAEAFLARGKGDAAAMAVVRTGVSNAYLSMGIDRFSTALIREPELVHEVLERFCEWSVAVARNVHELDFDLFLVPDDLGFSNGPMMSLSHFRTFCLPVMRRLIGSLQRPAVYHSDGDIHALLPDIVSLGVAGVANIEPGPMDIARVKREFGDRVAVMGNVDLHHTLTQGTREETRDEVRRLIRTIGPGGRYVMASANSLPDYVDPDNVRVMAETLLEYGQYPLVEAEAPPEPASVGTGPAAAAAASAVGPAGPVAAGDRYAAVQADLYDGDAEAMRGDVQALLDEGLSAREVLDQGLIPAMDVIGAQFRTGELFIPEVLLSAEAMNAAIDTLGPRLADAGEESRGKVLLGTVWGDMHNIGKNLVATMLRGAGFEVLDLGINVPAEQFAAMVAEYKPDVLGLSSLLTSTMPEMRGVLEALGQRELRGRVKVILGGAPVNAAFAEEAGADGFASNAGEAVALVKRLLGATPAA